MRIVIIVQARTGSSRLRGKVLTKIVDKPLLEHLLTRLKLSQKINDIVVATTEDDADKEVVKLAEKCKVKWFVGSKDDVLDRILKAAKAAKADIIVRVTADNPLTDPSNIDEMVNQHLKSGADYTFTLNMPIGTGAEVISVQTLEAVSAMAKKSYDREHVTPFIRRNVERFKIQFLMPPPKLLRPEYRLTVDYKEDLELMKEVFARLYVPNSSELFSLTEVVELLDKNPELLEINVR
ncbi:MAG: cytidylyltransferase domain-containing protein [Promethearchaeota archaeon]